MDKQDRTDPDWENQLATASAQLVIQIWTSSADHHPGPRLLEMPPRKGLTKVRIRSHANRIKNFLHRRRQPQKLLACVSAKLIKQDGTVPRFLNIAAPKPISTNASAQAAARHWIARRAQAAEKHPKYQNLGGVF